MHFSEPTLFEIPVLPRIRKFLSEKLKDEHGRYQPMLASPNSEGVSILIWAMAQSPRIMMQIGLNARPGAHRGPRTGGGRVLKLDEMSETLGLGICEYHSSRSHTLFNVAELNVISNWIDYIIRNEMITYCQASPQTPALTMIKQFCDRYDFSEDDLSESACRKALERFKKGLGAYNYNPKLASMDHFTPLTELAL